jgi:hypothetical protein
VRKGLSYASDLVGGAPSEPQTEYQGAIINPQTGVVGEGLGQTESTAPVAAQISRPAVNVPAPVVQVNMPPQVFNGRVVLDGKTIGQVVRDENNSFADSSLSPVIPVLGGR